jgi:rhamnosyltransferase
VNFSVCIPTLNAAAEWPAFWAALRMQTAHPSEVLVIDSASTDGTEHLARQAGCRVITLLRKDFRHGGTRQFAAEIASTSDVLVYLTQDSILANERGMENLVRAFQDPGIGAAYGRQLPRPDSSPIAAHARLFNYPAVSSVRGINAGLTGGFKSIFFSNSFGAYRRSALMKAGGFPRELSFGEDTVMAARLLQHGWKIAYQADASTYHSHNYSCWEEFRRACEIGRLHSSESWLLRDFGSATREGGKFILSELRYLVQRAPWLIPEAVLRTGLKYAGYRQGRSTPVGRAQPEVSRIPPDYAEAHLDHEEKVS